MSVVIAKFPGLASGFERGFEYARFPALASRSHLTAAMPFPRKWFVLSVALLAVVGASVARAQSRAVDPAYSPVVRIKGEEGSCTASVIAARVLLTAAHCTHFIFGPGGGKFTVDQTRAMPVIRVNGIARSGQRVDWRVRVRAWDVFPGFFYVNEYRARGRDIALIELHSGAATIGEESVEGLDDAGAVFGTLPVRPNGLVIGRKAHIGGHRRSGGWDQGGFLTGTVLLKIFDHVYFTDTVLWKTGAGALLAHGDSGAPVLVEGPGGGIFVSGVAVQMSPIRLFGTHISDGYATAEDIDGTVAAWIRAFLDPAAR